MQTDNILQVFTAKRHTNPHYQCQLEHRASGLYTAYTHCANSACHHPTDSAAIHRPRLAISHNNLALNRCSKLIAIKLCAISDMHAKVRRESVAGYATDETLVCGPKEHTRWWQRYRGHLQGLLYRLILSSYLSTYIIIHTFQIGFLFKEMCGPFAVMCAARFLFTRLCPRWRGSRACQGMAPAGLASG